MNRVISGQTGRPPDSACFWRDDDVDGLELLKANYVRFTFDRHIHENYAIGVIERGAEAFDLRGEQHRAPAGKIIMVNPGEVHNGKADSDQGWVYRMFYLPAGFMEGLAREMGGSKQTAPFLPRAVSDDPGLAAGLLALHLHLENPSTRFDKQVMFRLVFSRLLRCHASEKPVGATNPHGRDRVSTVKDYLRDNYGEQVSLAELSGMTGVTPYHLIRLFNREVGLPPHAYLNQIRIHRAKQMLNRGRAIADAALAAGFTDQSHLTRRFKAAFGITPGRYLKSISYKN